MADNDWNAIQYFANSINASAGMIAAADLNRANRQFYQEQYDVQRDFNRAEREAAQAYNTSERIAVQDFNMNMWNLNNEYNSPSAQMSRMIEAGINPNAAAMAIGQSGASASPVTSSPMSSPSASVSPPGMPQTYNPVEAMASIQNMNATAEQQLSQAHLNQAVADKTREETTGLVIDNKFKPFEKQADLDSATARINLMVKNGELSEAQAQNLTDMLPLLKGKTLAETNKLFADAKVSAAELGKIQETIRLISEQVTTEKHKQAQLSAAEYEAYMNGAESQSNINVNGKKMSVLEAEAELKKYEGTAQDLKNKWREHCQSLGYDPDSSGLDRLIDESGSVIRLFESYGSKLIDNVKLKLNSSGLFGQ